MQNLLFTLVLCVAVLFNAQAQDVSYEVTASKSEILVGNKFTVTYTIKNAEIENFRPTHFEGFELIAGPNTSSSMQSINGEVTRQQSYTYILLANKEGDFQIDATEVEIEDNDYSSIAIPIKVLPNPEGIIEPLQNNDDPFGDFFQDRSFSFPQMEDVTPIPVPKKKRPVYKL